MVIGRMYIPKHATVVAPSLPALRPRRAERKAVGEIATGLSFLAFQVLLVAIISFLVIEGPPSWGPLP